MKPLQTRRTLPRIRMTRPTGRQTSQARPFLQFTRERIPSLTSVTSSQTATYMTALGAGSATRPKGVVAFLAYGTHLRVGLTALEAVGDDGTLETGVVGEDVVETLTAGLAVLTDIATGVEDASVTEENGTRVA